MADSDYTPTKFSDPDVTAKGETRASVGWTGLKTLWLNTGTLCNIECTNCYIQSSLDYGNGFYYHFVITKVIVKPITVI